VILVENLKFFPSPCILRPAGFEYRRWGVKNLSDGASGPNKKFDDIFSCV